MFTMSTIIVQKALFMIDREKHPIIEEINIDHGYISFPNGDILYITELAKEYNKLFLSEN